MEAQGLQSLNHVGVRAEEGTEEVLARSEKYRGKHGGGGARTGPPLREVEAMLWKMAQCFWSLLPHEIPPWKCLRQMCKHAPKPQRSRQPPGQSKVWM